jgi:integrase
MSSKKTPSHSNSPDQVLAEAQRYRDQREQTYRAQALKLYPWICARCGREFSGKKLRELTVHHKDHNHDNNPPDGSNWELLYLNLPPRTALSQLPQVLSVTELQRLVTRAKNPRNRVLLMTTYAAGLRVSEVVRLKLTDIESERGLIRVEQAKDARIATRCSPPAS